MNLTTRTAFAIKNFREHMRITDNLTLAGLLKRYARKHPTACRLAKGSTVLAGAYFILMSLFPGTSLPLQRDIKLSLLALYRPPHSAPASPLRPGTTTSSVPSRSSTSSSSTRSRWLPSTPSSSTCPSWGACWAR